MVQLANAIIDKETIKREATEGDINILTFFGGDALWQDMSFTAEKRDINNSFILDHPVNSLLDGVALLGDHYGAWSDFASSNAIQSLVIAGRSNVADWLASGSNSYPTYMAAGDGTTVFADTQTALATELSWARVALTHTLADKKVTLKGNFRSLVSGTGREFGIFDNSASGSGDMFIRRVLDQNYSKANTEEWRFNVTLSGSNNVPVMDVGINAIRDWFASGTAGATYPQFMSWASGTNVIAVTDTGMETIHQTNAISSNRSDGTKAILEGVLAASEASGNTVNRIGLWSASGSGTLYLHQATPDIAKDTTFQIQSRGEIRLN